MKPFTCLSLWTVFLASAVVAAPTAPVNLQVQNSVVHVQGFGGGSVDTGGFSSDDISAENIERAIEQGKEAIKDFDGSLPLDATSIIDSLRENSDFCERVGAAARIDCLSDKYAETARSFSNRGPERELKKAFRSASKKLRRIVRQNQDRSASKIMPKSKTTASSRPLQQVKVENQRRANAQAQKVIEELQTVILRSKGSRDQTDKYAQIAQAVASDKLLLRS